MNPQPHGATRAIAQEKTPTQTSWGSCIGGGVLDLKKRHTNVTSYLGGISCVRNQRNGIFPQLIGVFWI
jgi:hypothetical protein